MSETLRHEQPTSVAPSAVTAADILQVERDLIDTSLRKPVLFLYSTAILWLLAATLIGFLASIKTHNPEFLGHHAWLTYGRLWPAYCDVLAYGWAVQAGLATALWIFARLSRVSVRRSGWIICGSMLWNLGVAMGLLQVVAGNGAGREWMNFPPSVMTLLLTGYIVMGAWVLAMFRLRRPGHVFISVWYLLAACLWFPWAVGTANWLFGNGKLVGVMQAVVAAWYAQNFLYVFLTAIGLGTIYYLVPKITGRPVAGYALATMSFWGLLIFGSWTGMTRLVGAPLPAWMITSGITAALLVLLPVAIISANWLLTLRGNYHLLGQSFVLRFTLVAAAAFTLAHVLQAVCSFREPQKVLAFSLVGVGQSHLMLYGFVSMALFGAMYFIIPRLTGCTWFSTSMIRIHFVGATIGMGVTIVALLLFGTLQGAAWADIKQPMIAASLASRTGLIARSVAWFLLVAAHLVFAAHFLLMLLRLGQPGDAAAIAPSGGKEVA